MMNKDVIIKLENIIEQLKSEILEKQYLLDQLLSNLEDNNDNI